MAWDRSTPQQLKTLCIKLAPAVVVGAVIALSLFTPTHTLLLLGLMMVAWLGYGSLLYIKRMRSAQIRLMSPQGLRHVASATAHVGLAIFILGMTLTATLKQTYEMPLTAKAPMVMGDYSLRLITARRLMKLFSSRRSALIRRKL